MDSVSFDRVNRTLLTFWQYITEAVEGFFRSEPTNIDDADLTRIDQVSDRASENAAEGDDRKVGDDVQQSDFSTASAVCTSPPAVASQQWCADVRQGADTAQVQYIQEAIRGSENQVVWLREVATTPSITKKTAVKLQDISQQSDYVRDRGVCEDALRSADVPENLLEENELKRRCSDKTEKADLESKRALQRCEDGDEGLPADGASDMEVAGLLETMCFIQDAWTEEETLDNSGWSLISNYELTTDRREDMMDEIKNNEGEEEGDGSVVKENTTNKDDYIDKVEVTQNNKLEDVKEGDFMSKPTPDSRRLDINIITHSAACRPTHGGQTGEVLEIITKTSEEDDECPRISGNIHDETCIDIKPVLAGLNRSINKGRSEIEGGKNSLEEILATHPIALTAKTEHNNRGEITAKLNSVSLRQRQTSFWSQELNCLADEESQEGVPECNNGQDKATAQTLVLQGDSGEIYTAHLPEKVERREAECIEAAQQKQESAKTSCNKESHWDMVLERQARVTCLNLLPGETETAMNETVADQSDKAVRLDDGQGVAIDETCNRLDYWTEGKTLSDSAALCEISENLDIGQTKRPVGEETVMLSVFACVPASETGKQMDVIVSEDNSWISSLPEADESIKNCSENQIRTVKPDIGVDTEDVTSTNDNRKETINLLTTRTTDPLSKKTDGRENSLITRSESFTSTDSELPGKLVNMKPELPDQPQQNSDNKLNDEPPQESMQIKSKPGETVTMAREMVIHNVMENVSSLTTPGLGENVSGQTTETDEEILDMWIKTVFSEDHAEPEEREPELAGLQPDRKAQGRREQLAEESVLDVTSPSTKCVFSYQTPSGDCKDMLMTVSQTGSARNMQEMEDTPTELADSLKLSAKVDFHDEMEALTVNTAQSHTKESPSEIKLTENLPNIRVLTPETRCYELQTEDEESTQETQTGQGKLTDSHFPTPKDAKEPSGMPMEGAVVKIETDSDLKSKLCSEFMYHQDFMISSRKQLVMVDEIDGPQTPSRISFKAGDLLTFNTTGLDFTPQKWRITVKNSRTRPPKHPRKLLHMPSVDPSPSKSSSQSPMKALAGLPLGGLGVGIKLPGLGVPVLKKTHMLLNREITEHCSQQTAVQESEVKEGSSPKAEFKPKWIPPGHPGFGNPLMSELKSKLKKTNNE